MLHMSREEEGFFRALRDQAAFQQWDDWTVTRMIFADWLDDHDRPDEAAMARAKWRFIGSIHDRGRHGLIEEYTVEIGGWGQRHDSYVFYKETNGRRYLHFEPHTMLVKWTSHPQINPRKGYEYNNDGWLAHIYVANHIRRRRKTDMEVRPPFGMCGLFMERTERSPELFDWNKKPKVVAT